MGHYSRSNEDEIIARLLLRVDLPADRRVCVDIGAKAVENSNVARLIVEDGWRGILIDRGIKNFWNLYRETYAWRVCLIRDTVYPHNVNDLLPQDFGLLSLDIDGQDYHVWKAIKATPPIVVIEYNPRKKGLDDIQPRDDRYEWKAERDFKAFGASRPALEALGRTKGYELVDANTDNLFFMRAA